MPLDLTPLTNPVWKRSDNLRDPCVWLHEGVYHLFYTRYSNGNWNRPENWSVAHVQTTDWQAFTGDRDLTPKGFASPGDVIWWHGRWVLPYESYPVHPSGIYFSESDDLLRWSEPQAFLTEARQLPWNTLQRVIDPNFVVWGETLYAFFVGSRKATGDSPRANLLGLARTQDPALQDWEILSVDAPLLGADATYPDGVENVAIFRQEAARRWIMLYSAGLKKQQIAAAASTNLTDWQPLGPVEIPGQEWNRIKHGAPYVFGQEGAYYLILMGEENAQRRSSFGLAHSVDGNSWTLLPAATEPHPADASADDLPF